MNSWVVASPCTSRCVTSASHADVTGLASGDSAGALPARVPTATALRRYTRFVAALGSAVAAGTGIADPAVLRRHARALVDALGISLDATGPLRVPDTTRGTLIVANHVSWLDVVAALAVDPVPLLAKREVAGWPVVGALSRRAGTRFVDRDALRELVGVVRELTEHLDSGGSVMVFPQATTWCTAPGGPFRRAAFQAALDAGAPVRPVGIDFSQNGRVSTAASYVGDATLEASVRRVAFSEGLVARVTACTPLRPDGHDRRSLAAAAYAAVCEAVGRPVPVEGPNAVPGETDGPTTGP